MAVLVLVFTLGWTTVRATDRTWTGNVSGNWSNPGNWNPAGMPQAGDNLTFDQRQKFYRLFQT